MSRVFLAEETRLGRQVVIKVLPPEMGAAVNVERFEREIKLARPIAEPRISVLHSPPAPPARLGSPLAASRPNAKSVAQ